MLSLLKKLFGGNKEETITAPPVTETVTQEVKKPAVKPATKKPRAPVKKKASAPKQ